MQLPSRLLTLALTLAAAICCLSTPVNLAAQTNSLESQTRAFCFDWKFIKGDPTNAQQVKFDDSSWEKVDLPHDWSIAGPLNRHNPGGSRIGYFPTGIGWYRKHFRLPSADNGKEIFVQFDGVYENSEVWINGHSLGRRPYGYVSFQHNLTPYMKFGADNVLAVRVDNSQQPNSRWYSGSGINRLVHLKVADKLHVKTWGTYVTTPQVSKDQATVRIRTEVQNDYAESRNCILVTRILNSSNQIVAGQEITQKISAQSEHQFDQEIKVPNPQLWSVADPKMYQVQTLVKIGREVCDDYETPFGIRQIRFDKDKGFLLNGEPVKMKGICMHDDAGSLGTAVPERAWERRFQILKSIGCNAIRTSHNPPPPEFLALCDRIGFLVVEEAFDKWKAPYGRWFAQWGRRDLSEMIRRDRNHPSVVVWSMGNEISNQGGAEFTKKLKSLVALTHKMDPTRPTTVALHPIKPKSREENAKKVAAIARLVDVIGCNYQEQWFEDYRKADPGIIIIATESYPYYRGKGLDYKAFYPMNPWLEAAKHDYVLGTFYWAGVDYLGEAVAGWPYHGWNCSLIDTCGDIRPVAYLIKSFWTKKPMVHIAVMDESLDVPKPVKAHWGWPKMASDWTEPQLAGKKVKVATFSNCGAVELLVNGKSMGTKKLADFPNKIITWTVPYEPGRIEARGIEQGRVVATHELQTAGKPAQIRLMPDRSRIQADGRDLCYVDVQITDGQGIRVPSAGQEIHFHIEGAGKIIGVDNGDLTSMESYKGDERKAFHGRAQVIIQAARKPGTITLTAQADGLPVARVIIEAR